MTANFFRASALLAVLPALLRADALPTPAGPDDFIAHARLHNAELAAATHRVEAARERIGPARTLPDPMLMYGYYLRRMETRQVVGVSQSFPYPGTLSRRGAVAEARAEVQFQEAEAVRLSVEEAIRASYAELALLEESIRLVAENKALLDTVAGVVESRLAAGRSASADLIRIEVERIRLEDEQLRLEARRPSLQARLNALAGRDPNDTFPALQPLTDLVEDPASAPSAHHPLAHNPALEGIERALEGSRAAIELAERDGRPGFSVGAEWMDTRGGGRDEVRLTFGISLPVWRERYRSGVREARAEQRALEADHLDLRRRLLAEIRAAEDTLRDAERRLGLYEGCLLDRAREALAAEESAYRAGGSDLLNLIDARRVLLDIELTHRQALAEAYTARAVLRRILGDH